MIKKLKLFSLLMLLTLSIGQAWGTTVTYAQSSTSAAAVSSGTAPAGSSVTFANTYTNNKEQITSGNTMTLTLSGYDGYEITGVSVSVHNNKSSGAGSGSLTINGESKGSLSSITGLGNSGWTVKDFTVTTTTVASKGKVVIVLSCSTSSVYCNAFTITYGTPAAVATPTLSKATGTYLGTQNVTVSNYDEDLIYFYTTDGTTPAADANLDPTGTSLEYDNSTGIAISSSCTLKVIAYNISSETSNVASATYTIYNTTHAGTADDPYSVADARLVIDYGTSEQKTNVYAAGIVSQVISSSVTSDGQISYNISTDGQTTSDQLQAYNGKNKNGASFTALTDVKVGDEVVVKGNLKKYNSTYEFDANNTLESQARTPNFTIANVANLAEGATLTVTQLNPNKDGSAGDVTLVSSNNEAAVKIVDNALQAVKAGDATITANLAASGIYKAAVAEFTVHVYEPCTNLITLSKGTPEHGSFTMDQAEDVYPTCEAALVVVVTPDADEHYHVSAVVAPNSASISEPDEDGKYTVTYAQNTNAASEINVTFAEDTKYEVKWYANKALIATEIYYYDQKIAKHAAPAALSSIYQEKEFIGWVETELDASQDEQPDLADFTDMAAAAKTFYTLYATATKTADASLTKLSSAPVAGDNIVIVAGTYALYQETTNSTYVKNWTFENSAETVGANDKNYVTLKAVPEKSTFYLGDGANGYLYTSGSNNLAVTTDNSTEWAIAWNNTQSKFTIIGEDRWLACRTDLTSSYVNLFRMGGDASKDPNGTAYFDIYKFVPAVYAYSAYVTTVPEATFTVKWSLGEGPDENLGELERVLDFESKPTDSYAKYFDKEILHVGTYDVKLFKDGAATAITTTLEVNAVAKYYLQFDYDSAKGELTATASNPRTPTSVDNTELSNKAVKFIQNGQMFIELNGRVYNAFGQTVK